MQRTLNAEWETYSVQEIFSTQLLALIEEQAVYKFVVSSEHLEYANAALFVRSQLRYTNPYIPWLIIY